MLKLEEKNPVHACAGLLVVTWNNGSVSLGTGTLISPTRILTCAHNIVESVAGEKEDKITGVEAKSVVFYLGYIPKGDIKNLEQIPKELTPLSVDWCVYHAGYKKNTRCWDVAILVLESKQEDVEKFPFLLAKGALEKKEPKEVSLFSPLLNIGMSIFGYRFIGDIVVSEVNTKLNLIVHDAPTKPGVSGSPIYIKDVICGIHTSRSKYGFGVGMFDVILDWIYSTARLGKSSNEFVTALD